MVILDCRNLFYWKYMAHHHLEIKGKDEDIKELIKAGTEAEVKNVTENNLRVILGKVNVERTQILSKLTRPGNTEDKEIVRYLDLLHFQVLLSISIRCGGEVRRLYIESIKEIATMKKPIPLLEARHRIFIGFYLIDFKLEVERKENVNAARKIMDKLKTMSEDEKKVDADWLGMTLAEYNAAYNRQHMFFVDLYAHFFMHTQNDHKKTKSNINLFLKSVIFYKDLDAMAFRFVNRLMDLSTESQKGEEFKDYRQSSYALHLAGLILDKYGDNAEARELYSKNELNGFRGTINLIFVQHLTNLMRTSCHLLKTSAPHPDIAAMEFIKYDALEFQPEEDPMYLNTAKSKAEVRAMHKFTRKVFADGEKLALKNDAMVVLAQTALNMTKKYIA